MNLQEGTLEIVCISQVKKTCWNTINLVTDVENPSHSGLQTE